MKSLPMYEGRVFRPHEWQYIVDRLREGQDRLQRTGRTRRVEYFDPGLSDEEIRAAEHRFDIRFPPDLRMFLQLVVPRGKDLPNWRAPDDTEVRRLLDWPREGILFDVRHGVWEREWGAKPGSIEKAIARVNALLDAAPRLIPIYAIRMIPMEPFWHGNPVFSVHETDVIIYGNDLVDYFEELGLPPRAVCTPLPERTRTIPFWTALTRVELAQPHTLMAQVRNNRLVKLTDLDDAEPSADED